MSNDQRENVKVASLNYESDNMLYLQMEDGRVIGLNCNDILKVTHPTPPSPVETVNTGVPPATPFVDYQRLKELEETRVRQANSIRDLQFKLEQANKKLEDTVRANTDIRTQFKMGYDLKLQAAQENCTKALEAQLCRAVRAEEQLKKASLDYQNYFNKYNQLLGKLNDYGNHFLNLSGGSDEDKSKEAQPTHVQASQPLYR